VSSGHGKLRPDGPFQTLELAEGERNGNVKITMWKFAAISGVLTDEVGEPFVGATVLALRRSTRPAALQMVDDSSAFTDDRGVFRISTLAPGDYMICVTASQTTLPASLVDAYGQARVAGGTAAADLARPLSTTALGFTASAATPGNRSGDVVVQTVGPVSQGPLSFQTTFYPTVVSMAQAEIIKLGSGEERTGADIRLKLVPGAPVTGTLMGPNGPLAGIGVRLVPGYSPDLGSLTSFDTARTVSDASGRFSFMGVPAGQYVLRALKITPASPGQLGTGPRSGAPAISQEPTFWANVPITVGAEGIRNLAVRVGTGFRITGRIVYDGSTPKPAPSALPSASVQVIPAEGTQLGYPAALRGVSDADGTFTTAEIPPGKYVIRFTGTGGGWSLKSAMFQGRDVSYLAFTLQSNIDGVQIVMTDRPASVHRHGAGRGGEGRSEGRGHSVSRRSRGVALSRPIRCGDCKNVRVKRRRRVRDQRAAAGPVSDRGGAGCTRERLAESRDAGAAVAHRDLRHRRGRGEENAGSRFTADSMTRQPARCGAACIALAVLMTTPHAAQQVRDPHHTVHGRRHGALSGTVMSDETPSKPLATGDRDVERIRRRHCQSSGDDRRHGPVHVQRAAGRQIHAHRQPAPVPQRLLRCASDGEPRVDDRWHAGLTRRWPAGERLDDPDAARRR
jgi:hypothetical protein